MKKRLCFAVVIGIVASASAQAATTLTFTTNLEADNVPFPSIAAASNAAFGTLGGASNPDFRLMFLDGSLAGGGEKAISAGVVWDFNNAGDMTAVSNSDMTAGCTLYCTTNGGTSSANSSGDVGLFKSAPFLGAGFGFLAPTVGSAAAAAYGVAAITGDTDGNGAFTISFPVLEVQWRSSIFTVGKTSNGLGGTGTVFNCTSTAGVFACQGGAVIDAADDTLGFAGQEVQFDLTGTMPAVPVPAAVWLFGSGLFGLVGVARRRRA